LCFVFFHLFQLASQAFVGKHHFLQPDKGPHDGKEDLDCPRLFKTPDNSTATMS
jgi:hypothetical protein